MPSTSDHLAITLHALVIKLITSRLACCRAVWASWRTPAFTAAVQAVDPVLSAQMHDAQGRSAFSLSPLYGYWRTPADRQIHVSQGQAWLRLGVLDDRLFAVFMQHLLTNSRPSIRLGDVYFAISEVLG